METRKKVGEEAGETNLSAKQDMVKPQPPQVGLVTCQAPAPAPDVAANLGQAPAPEVAANCDSKKETPLIRPPPFLDFYPTTIFDTSAPTCVTRTEYYILHRLANADPRELVFNIINPATGLLDDVFKASVVNRYRNTNVHGIAHELPPGASVLKRFREELGASSKRASVPKRFREEFGESSESESLLKLNY